MKIGDLIRLKTPTGRRPKALVGVLIKDNTMMCSHGVYEPYRMGTMTIFWSNGWVRDEVFADLEKVNG